MDKLLYRKATEEDIPFISRVYAENIAALHGIHKTYEKWKEHLSERDTIYYIVYDTAPVAWFRLDLEEDGLWLGMLQVSPQHHRKGIGRQILSFFEDMAKENGFRRVGIHTTEDNLAARALYTAAGYTLTEIGPCTTADGIDRVGYTFEKHICL